MDAAQLQRNVHEAIRAASERKGLPISIRMAEMSRLGRDELLTISCLAGPLLVWRGRLCYAFEDELQNSTLEPSWILYEADESSMSSEVANLAGDLSASGLIVTLPERHFPGRLESLGRDLQRLPTGGQKNYGLLTKMYSELASIDQVPYSPARSQPDSCQLRGNLILPVMLQTSGQSYARFSDEFGDDLTRLQHALRDAYVESQSLSHETSIHRVVQELDYQIARLNSVYEAAARSRKLSGVGALTGSVVAGLSLLLPLEFQPYLAAVATQSTLFAGLKWLARTRDPERRQSDYYLAWKFRTS
ncbi:hypothetical protein JYT20_00210 [Rhodothermus sp. AH-315-K08]|nr:hypothetical protein [Rhodothermus sp. AH-315-K08]